MFCPKCGAEAIDGADFCQKCGAKLIVDVSASQQPAADPTTPKQQPSNSSAGTRKKKSKKLPIILGIVALAIILVIIVIVHFSSSDEADYISMTELTQTFTSESDGISFQYPKAWESLNNDNESLVVRMCNSDIYSFIYVWKFTEMPTIADSLYDMSDDMFLETLVSKDSNTVSDISNVTINGVSAREVCFSTSDSNVGTVYYHSYFYTVGSTLYRVDLVKKEINPIDVDRVFAAIMDSYTITADDAGSQSSIDPNSALPAVQFPLSTSTDAMKLFDDWAADHPMGFDSYHLDLISDDEVDDNGNKVFLFGLETNGAGIFNISIRKSDGYIEYIDKLGSISMDDWYEELFGEGNATYGLSYEGVSLTDILGCAPVQLYETLGTPISGTPVNGDMYAGGEYYGYEGILFIIDYATTTVRWITGAAEAVEVNGITLDKTRTELIDLIGTPESEENVYDEMEGTSYYIMRYILNGAAVDIEMADVSSRAETFIISLTDN